MTSAQSEVGQPCAPRNGVYFRMEDDDVQKRFNNGFKMEILNDVAHVEKGKSKRRKSYICRLTDDEDALIIDWSSVDHCWGTARLQYGCMESNFGMLEAGEKFWRLGEEYSAERVDNRKRELQAGAGDEQSRATSVVVQKPRWMLTHALAMVRKPGWVLTPALTRRRAPAIHQLHPLRPGGKPVHATKHTLSMAQLLQLHLSVDGTNHTPSRIIVAAAGARRDGSRNL